MKTLILILSSLLLFITTISRGVNGQAQSFQHLPDGMQSPTAASLGKFGDIPVNLYSGSPTINIPLYKAQGGKLSLPIQLKYHASGVKVREIAGWVGLGWALDAGGVITRTVRGLPDESTYGYLNTQNELKDLISDPSIMKDVIDGVERQVIDSKPDIFYFNFAGRSGKFLLTEEGMTNSVIHGKFIADKQITIEWKNPNSNNDTNKFIVTVEDGIRFIFSEREVVEEYSDLSYWNRAPYEASWYLTKIESPEYAEIIELEYDLATTDYFFDQDVVATPSIEVISCDLGGSRYPQGGGTHYYYHHNLERQPILKRIKTKKETVVFSSNFQRTDPGNEKLNTITIFRDDSLFKQFELDYTYNNSNADEDSERRLLLEKVTEVGPNGKTKPPYRLIYDATSLPDRLSYGIDYWGYYNGKDSNSTLIPKYKNLPGGDRTPSFPEMQAGSLTKIIYPTGGSTEIVYEPHAYNWIGNEKLPDELFYKSKTATATAGDNTPLGMTLDDYQSFTIDHQQEVEINYLLKCNDPTICGSSPTYVKLKNENNEVVSETFIDGGETQWKKFEYLWPGEYTVEAHAVEYSTGSGETDHTYANIQVDYKIEEFIAGEQNKMSGGLRVAKIIDSPGTSDNQVVRTFKYYMAEDSLKSSGVLVNKPVHYYNGKIDLVLGLLDEENSAQCDIEFRSSSSTIPLGSTQGSHIGYQYVTTIFGANGEGGRTISKFVTARTEQDEIPKNDVVGKPGIRTSKDWRRGRKISDQVFKENGKLIKKAAYEYDSIELTTEAMMVPDYYFNVAPDYPVLQFSHFTYDYNEGGSPEWNLFLTSLAERERGVTLNIKKTEKTFDSDQNSFVETSQSYTYNENKSDISFAQLTKKTETNSDSTQRITEFRYAHEITDDGTGASYTPMKDLNMLTQPYSVTVKDSTGVVLSKRWTLWDDSDGWWRPRGQWQWEGGNPDAPVFNSN